jgi:hypothetical protein
MERKTRYDLEEIQAATGMDVHQIQWDENFAREKEIHVS